ncbi:hypothetical protein MtrunA17_Chr4g0023501 [Medicago truncatula]|uniref:Uncharacterized protein n=1 Tax=Medicago truncatula TaxID=3880 RepID=A0A396I661_MEDTR|nr:hypothetical protein MtrunA17_Chr4g0023501 [Medicago truncatula]
MSNFIKNQIPVLEQKPVKQRIQTEGAVFRRNTLKLCWQLFGDSTQQQNKLHA